MYLPLDEQKLIVLNYRSIIKRLKNQLNDELKEKIFDQQFSDVLSDIEGHLSDAYHDSYIGEERSLSPSELWSIQEGLE